MYQGKICLYWWSKLCFGTERTNYSHGYTLPKCNCVLLETGRVFETVFLTNTCLHAKNHNDPCPATWRKAALREVVFSSVAILRGGWLQSPASDGPPWYGSQRCDFSIIDRHNTYWPSNHSIFVNPAFWIMISTSCVGPLKWSAPTFKEQLIPNIILICSRDILNSVKSDIRRSPTETIVRYLFRNTSKAEGCMYWIVSRIRDWTSLIYLNTHHISIFRISPRDV